MSIFIKIVAGFCLFLYTVIYIMAISGKIVNEKDPSSTKYIASLAFLPVIFISLMELFGVA